MCLLLPPLKNIFTSNKYKLKRDKALTHFWNLLHQCHSGYLTKQDQATGFFNFFFNTTKQIVSHFICLIHKVIVSVEFTKLLLLHQEIIYLGRFIISSLLIHMFYQKQSHVVEHVSQKCWHDSSQRTLHSKIKVSSAGSGVVTRHQLNSWSMSRQSSKDTTG